MAYVMLIASIQTSASTEVATLTTVPSDEALSTFEFAQLDETYHEPLGPVPTGHPIAVDGDKYPKTNAHENSNPDFDNAILRRSLLNALPPPQFSTQQVPARFVYVVTSLFECLTETEIVVLSAMSTVSILGSNRTQIPSKGKILIDMSTSTRISYIISDKFTMRTQICIL
jgi:hypothetical protein